MGRCPQGYFSKRQKKSLLIVTVPFQVINLHFNAQITTRASPFGNETGMLPMAVFEPHTENFNTLKTAKVLVIGAGKSILLSSHCYNSNVD